MSRFNQIANSEQDPLIVHSKDLAVLLPHRPPNISPIDRNTFRQLYQALTCIICRQLFQSPVLLRCSHRFCRACIEHRIRSTNKKYCPTCNAPLLTKRELRSDDFTLDFIDVVFGNLSFSGETKLENAEL